MKLDLARIDRDGDEIRTLVSRHTDQPILSIQFNYNSALPGAEVYVGVRLVPMIGCGEKFTLIQENGAWVISHRENWMSTKLIA